MSADRCDGCGRFVAADASMDVSIYSQRNGQGEVEIVETRLCVECSPASAGT